MHPFREKKNQANSLDTDHAEHFIGPDRIPDCLQTTMVIRIKVEMVFCKVHVNSNFISSFHLYNDCFAKRLSPVDIAAICL